MKTANYIEGKLEEFRLSGKTPIYIGLSQEKMELLAREIKPKNRMKNVEWKLSVDSQEIVPYFIVTEFLGLRVYTEIGPHMPADGVYIQEKNEGNDSGL